MAQSGKKGRWAEVTCAIHGRKDPDLNWMAPQVAVSIPATKRKRQEGCPQCRKNPVAPETN
jgi:hypothetical protein